MKKETIIDLELFAEPVVDRAIRDYSKIAIITKKKIDNTIKCTVRSFSIDVDTVINEFNNYLIELSQEKRYDDMP